MGLDMYLTAKRYVSDYDDADKALGTELMRHFPELAADQTIQEVTVRVGYWRKANAIHQWFVDNVQDGEDNCASYYVSREALDELKAHCALVLANRDQAADELPTASGFFFGSTEYDAWYFQSLEHTVEILDRALSLMETGSWNIEYHASW